jgi:HSP20 family protein
MDAEETCTMVDFEALVPWKSRAEVPATRNDFDPFVGFRREVDRVFEDFFSGSRTGLASWQNLAPAVGIDETDNELVITAELPGVSEKDIEVSLSGDVLTVRGRRRPSMSNATVMGTTRNDGSVRLHAPSVFRSRPRTAMCPRLLRTAS